MYLSCGKARNILSLVMLGSSVTTIACWVVRSIMPGCFILSIEWDGPSCVPDYLLHIWYILKILPCMTQLIYKWALMLGVMYKRYREKIFCEGEFARRWNMACPKMAAFRETYNPKAHTFILQISEELWTILFLTPVLRIYPLRHWSVIGNICGHHFAPMWIIGSHTMDFCNSQPVNVWFTSSRRSWPKKSYYGKLCFHGQVTGQTKV